MIISISGKKRSGKDTAGKIAQILLSFKNISNEDIIKYLDGGSFDNPKWIIKKWASKLKDLTSLLTGFSVQQLESEDVKNTILSKVYIVSNKFIDFEEEYKNHKTALGVYSRMKSKYLTINNFDEVADKIFLIERDITPRYILQQLGTEIGRRISKNIWINALLNDYQNDLFNTSLCNWIITDTRFPNEVEAVKSLDGINIRIQRDNEGADLHESETALDDYEDFDYLINNNSTINRLIDTIRRILTLEKLLK